MNSRLDTLQAAILLAKLEVFPDEIQARASIGRRYSERIRAVCGERVVTPSIEPHNTCVYAQYTIEVEERDQVQKKLNAAGIPTAVHYPIPLHLQPAFRHLELGLGSFPLSEQASRRVMSLPMHPYLSEDEQDFIVEDLGRAVLA